MTTCREQILEAVRTTLASLNVTIVGLTVERERQDPPTTDELPFFGIYDDGNVEQPDFCGERDWTLTATVEGYFAGATALEARQKADAGAALVTKTMFADVTLGGLARNVRPSAESTPPRTPWEFPTPVGGFSQSFEVDYATSETDLTVFA